MVEAPLPQQGKRTFWQLALHDGAIFDGNPRLMPLLLHVPMRRRVIGEIHAHIDTEDAGDDWHGLHIPPVLPTHLIQRMADLAQRVVLHRLHQLVEQVAALSGG